MSLSNRVGKIEAQTGRTGAACALCERRAASVEASPVMRPGFVETPDDTYTMSCPSCGASFTIQIVYVTPRRAAA